MHPVIEEISESNSWRDGEFAKFKINASKIDETLWCRMCVPMIYAHWEGFVVDSMKILISHLNKLELTPRQVTTNLVVFGLGDKYKKLSGKQSFQQKIDFTESFNELFESRLKLPGKVDTKSNLNKKVLEEICHIFSLDYDEFRDFSNEIDRLVMVRNNIAHGENSFTLTISNIEKYIASVSLGMDTLTNQIDQFLKDEKYLIAS